MRITCILATGLALLSATSPAWAQNFVTVDINGGPGVDFTDLQEAVTQSPTNSILLVEPGVYAAPLRVDKGVRIAGRAGARLASVNFFDLYVRGLPAGQIFALSGFDGADFLISNCDGTVILDGLMERRLDGTAAAHANPGAVENCHDVRLRGFLARSIRFSHVECVQSLDTLGGVDVTDQSSLHVVAAHWTGLEGAGCGGWQWCIAGDGGPAIDARLNSTVVVSSSQLQGGDGGWDTFDPFNWGFGAPGLVIREGILRLSGSSLAGGRDGGGAGTVHPPYSAAPSTVVTDVQGNLDPVLLFEGHPTQGGALLARVIGTPGDTFELLMGRAAVRIPVAGSPVAQLASADRVGTLGTLPAPGQVDYQFPIPAHWAPGTLLFMQLRATSPGGQVRMSNSMPFMIGL